MWSFKRFKRCFRGRSDSPELQLSSVSAERQAKIRVLGDLLEFVESRRHKRTVPRWIVLGQRAGTAAVTQITERVMNDMPGETGFGSFDELKSTSRCIRRRALALTWEISGQWRDVCFDFQEVSACQRIRQSGVMPKRTATALDEFRRDGINDTRVAPLTGVS